MTLEEATLKLRPKIALSKSSNCGKQCAPLKKQTRALKTSLPPTLSYTHSLRNNKKRGLSPIGAREQILGRGDFPGYLKAINRLKHQKTRGLSIRQLGKVNGYPLHRIRLNALASPPKMRVLITAGVHGNEPSGPAAVLATIKHLLSHNELRQDIEYTIVPLISPKGYIELTRALDGVNFNRFFTDDPNVPPEVRMARSVMREQQYDLAIDVHASQQATGFFGLNPGNDEVLSRAMKRFSGHVMQKSTALYELEHPGVFRSNNVGTIKDYMASRGARWSYTIESPTRFSYWNQVTGLSELIVNMVEEARKRVKTSAAISSRPEANS